MQKFLTSKLVKNSNQEQIYFDISDLRNFLDESEQELANAVASIQTESEKQPENQSAMTDTAGHLKALCEKVKCL